VLLTALDAIAGTLDAPPAERPAPSPEESEAEASSRGACQVFRVSGDGVCFGLTPRLVSAG
jgi:hypothetical protein